MRRLILPLAAAALAAACYDAPSTPTASLLTPRSPASLDGIPPPPPVSGEGFGDFTATDATDNSETSCPTVHDNFTFAYDYLENSPDQNAYLHIRVDGNGLDIAVHETDKKITAKGTLTRPTFSFQINDVLDGTIFNKAEGAPQSVTLSLAGVLTVDGQSCAATATFIARLSDIIDQPPPIP